jgi:hypothetical protein
MKTLILAFVLLASSLTAFAQESEPKITYKENAEYTARHSRNQIENRSKIAIISRVMRLSKTSTGGQLWSDSSSGTKTASTGL